VDFATVIGFNLIPHSRFDNLLKILTDEYVPSIEGNVCVGHGYLENFSCSIMLQLGLTLSSYCWI
jgi:hypothetical protein